MAAADGDYDDDELLELWTKIKRESIDTRMVFIRQWHHHLLYFLGRQWIEWFGSADGAIVASLKAFRGQSRIY